MRKKASFLAPLILSLTLIIAWEIVANVVGKPYLFPSPVEIVQRMVELHNVLFFIHLPATLSIIMIGLILSTILGVGLAVLMHKSRIAEQTFYPILVMSQTIPIIALAPIFVLWFGYTIWSKVVVTVLITFFPITVNTFDGLRAVPIELRELFRTMQASRFDTFRKLFIPAALPSFLSGMKIAITLSVIGAAIGEWLGANAGLGYFSRRMMSQYDGPGVFAPIVWLSLIGVIGFLLIKALEIYLLRWRKTK